MATLAVAAAIFVLGGGAIWLVIARRRRNRPADWPTVLRWMVHEADLPAIRDVGFLIAEGERAGVVTDKTVMLRIAGRTVFTAVTGEGAAKERAARAIRRAAAVERNARTDRLRGELIAAELNSTLRLARHGAESESEEELNLLGWLLRDATDEEALDFVTFQAAYASTKGIDIEAIGLAYDAARCAGPAREEARQEIAAAKRKVAADPKLRAERDREFARLQADRAEAQSRSWEEDLASLLAERGGKASGATRE